MILLFIEISEIFFDKRNIFDFKILKKYYAMIQNTMFVQIEAINSSGYVPNLNP